MTDREMLYQLLGQLRAIRDRGGIDTYDSLARQVAGMAKEVSEHLNASRRK